MGLFSVLYVALLAAVSYWALTMFSGGLVMPGPGMVLVLSLMTLVDLLLRSARWKLLLDHYGMRVGFREAIKTFVAGLFFIVTPAKAGSVMKAELMQRRHGFGRKPVVFLTVVERMMDVATHVVFGGLTALLVASRFLRSIWAVGLGLVAVAALLYAFRHRLEFIRGELERLNDPPLLAKGMALSLASWGLEDLQLWLAVVWLGGQLSLAQAFFVFSASLVLGNLTFLPGGLGAMEASSVAMLALFGVAGPLATTATMTVRLTTFWLGFAAGAVAWLLSFHGRI